MRKMKNTMRYFSLAVLALAAAMMVGCEKDEIVGNAVSGTYTASVKMADNGSKALDALGQKTFAEGDQIAVIYVNTSNVTVKAVSDPLAAGDIAAGSKRANFKVTLENPDNTKSITYIYPAAMANDDGTINYDALAIQDGTLASLAGLDACKYTAANWGGSTLPVDVSLANELTICKFTVKEKGSGADITSTVSRLNIKNGSDIYTVNTSSFSTIWVAMKPVSSGYIYFYAAKGKDLYSNIESNSTLDAGKLYPVNVSVKKIGGALSGLFTKNSSGSLVYFSQGNVQATYNGSAWSWAFATNQWDYIGANTANTAINGNGTVSANGIVDLFGWVGGSGNLKVAPAKYGISNSKNLNDYGTLESDNLNDWGNAIGNTEYYTLSMDDWSYLLNSRTSGSTVNGTTNARYTYATINTDGISVTGLILFPDHVTIANSEATSWGTINNVSAWGTRCTNAQWVALEAKGCVFLPAAGKRSEDSVSNVGTQGGYWSASKEQGVVCKLFFSTSYLFTNTGCARSVGNSVRLVRNL